MPNANIDTKNAVKEINALIDSFNSLIKATGDVSTVSQANFRKVETALAALNTVSLQAASSFDKMNDAQKQAVLLNQQQATETTKAAKATELASRNQDKLKDSTERTSKATSGLISGVKQLISAFGIVNGIQIFANLVKNAFELAKQFDSLSFALNTIERDLQNVAESQRFLMQITQDYGVELVSTTERWIKFLAAAKQSGVTLKDTEDIFRSVTKASAVLGLQTDDLNSVYLALEQMMSKGKITTEELRRQLGEKLPGAIGIMAAAVGVNVNQLDSMLKKGEVLSAEVLPKFAKALEYAYNIETIDKVDTLISKQNELTNSWQQFVKSVMEGNGLLGKAFEATGMALKGFLHLITPQSALDSQKYTQTVLENQKKIKDMMIKDSKEILDNQLATGSKYADAEREAKAAALAYQQAVATGASDQQVKILQEEYAKKYKVVTDYDERLEAITRSRSIASLSMAQERFDKESKALLALEKEKKEAMESWDLVLPRSVEELTNLITEANKSKAAAEALLSVYKLNAETSTAVPFAKDDKPKRETPKYYLQDITNLANEEKMIRLKTQKDINDALLKGEEASLEERTKAQMDNWYINLEMADTQSREALEKAQDYYDDQTEKLEKAISQGKIIVGDQEKYRKDLKDNYNAQVEIATTKHHAALLAAEKEYGDQSVALAKIVEEDKIRIINNVANDEIVAAVKVFNASKKTKEDKHKLDEKLNEIAIEQANAVIDIQIETLENMLKMDGVSETVATNIDEQIRKLKASKKILFDKDDMKAMSDALKDLLDFIGESSQAITDLGDAIFDRRIEQINAEIKAETDKYDELIRLAAGNKEEQVRLQTEKDAKLKELEAKRLKEEQRKAKFDKVNALIQIAINTAIAASLVAAQTGVGAFVTVPMIIALGAIQAAAVLAQPIPKYEEGLKDAKHDHVGMINDGKHQEFVERGNSILTTKTKNAIINLKKGDTIYKSYDDMLNGSDMFQNLSRSILLNNLNKINNDQANTMEIMLDSQLKNLQKDIKKGIHDGFNKVTINNVTKIDLNWLAYKNDTL